MNNSGGDLFPSRKYDESKAEEGGCLSKKPFLWLSKVFHRRGKAGTAVEMIHTPADIGDAVVGGGNGEYQ